MCKVVIIDNSVYRHFPTEQTLYMPYCHKEVIAELDSLDRNFVKKVANNALDKIEFVIQSLEKLSLSRDREYIPTITDWQEISSDLQARINHLSEGVDKRKASFCAFHNHNIQPPIK